LDWQQYCDDNAVKPCFSQYIHTSEYHDKNSTGSLISKSFTDTEQVSNAAGKAFVTLVQEGALVIGLLISEWFY